MAHSLSPSITHDDRFALAELAARYAVAVDTRDFARLRDVFVADARLDSGRSVRDGIDAILDAMQGLLRYDATTHVLGQQLLEPHDGDIRGVTYCTAHHLTVADEQRTDRVMHIRYHDRFVPTDAGWRIANRRLELVWIDEQPVN
ncbi:MAG: nuclear transport factor 2 family protein [Acidimicrobiales bacterium]